MAEIGATNTINTRYIRGLNLVARKIDANHQYYQFNAHGDVLHLLDTNGNILINYRFDSFGNQVDAVDSDTNPFRYCGEYFDKETKTYYLRARNYNPFTGRFTSADPARSGNNWFIYCINNPLGFVDPSGSKESNYDYLSNSYAVEGAKGYLGYFFGQMFNLDNWKKTGKDIWNKAKKFGSSLYSDIQGGLSSAKKWWNSHLGGIIGFKTTYKEFSSKTPPVGIPFVAYLENTQSSSYTEDDFRSIYTITHTIDKSNVFGGSYSISMNLGSFSGSTTIGALSLGVSTSWKGADNTSHGLAVGIDTAMVSASLSTTTNIGNGVSKTANDSLKINPLLPLLGLEAITTGSVPVSYGIGAFAG